MEFYKIEKILPVSTKALDESKGYIIADYQDFLEKEFKGKGVAYCPHCDGPLFKGKHVAVIGGGNSGVEAAIDLANIVGHVTLFEFAGELKADDILQKRLYSLSNVDVILNAQTLEVLGSDKVNSMIYLDRKTNEKKIGLLLYLVSGEVAGQFQHTGRTAGVVAERCT